MEDSPGLEVQALLEGGALRVGLECGGDGGVGPTLVWYLRGAGASATGAWEAAAASAEPHGRTTWGNSDCRHSGGGGGSGRGRGDECRIRDGVGPANMRRRRVANMGPEAVPSTCLSHSRAKKGKEMKNGMRRV